MNVNKSQLNMFDEYSNLFSNEYSFLYENFTNYITNGPDRISWLAFSLTMVLFVFGIVANLSIIYIVVKNSWMRSTPNIMFVINLAVADLLHLSLQFLVLISIYFYDWCWTLGSFMCKFLEPCSETARISTIFTMTTLAIERYFVIVRPWRNRNNNSCVRLSRKCILHPSQQIVLIWVAAFSVMIVGAPIWISVEYTSDSNCPLCYFDYNFLHFMYLLFRLLVVIIIPLFIIVTVNTLIACALIKSIREPVTGDSNRVCRRNRLTYRERSRIKLAIVIIVLSVMFFVCWITFFVLDILFPIIYLIYERLFFWMNILMFLYSCLNPIMFYVLSTQFREQLFKNCLYCFGCYKSSDRDRQRCPHP